MSVSASRKALAVALVGSLWLLMTAVFWVGYVGTDDFAYSRYAYVFNRPPMNWWEFRIPAVLAIRASFLAFGPYEISAALPTLLASLSAVVSVAWFVRWPNLDWRATAAVALAATLPLDVGLRSVPGATYFATGPLMLGTVCLLRGRTAIQILGAALLACGFLTHEISFFYIAILCVTAVAVDWSRFWRPVAACVAISAGAAIVEGGVYRVLLGNFFARWQTSSATTAGLAIGIDPNNGISGLRFFTWPFENLLFCKAFGFDLLLVLGCGTLAWKIFDKEQRIVVAATFLTWAWLGYGSQVPWAYKPLYRQFHYYGPLVLGVAAMLPAAVSHVFGARQRLAQAVVAAAVLVHVACLAAGGRWGEDVDVSRELLRYANENRSRTFVTNVATMNQMYVIGGFEQPANVVCVNGPAVEQNLRLNKEREGSSRLLFPEMPIDGILVNIEGLAVKPAEAEFGHYLDTHPGVHTRLAAVRYRLLMAPMLLFMQPREFMIRSLGGEIVWLADRPSSTLDEGPEPPARLKGKG